MLFESLTPTCRSKWLLPSSNKPEPAVSALKHIETMELCDKPPSSINSSPVHPSRRALEASLRREAKDMRSKPSQPDRLSSWATLHSSAPILSSSYILLKGRKARVPEESGKHKLLIHFNLWWLGPSFSRLLLCSAMLLQRCCSSPKSSISPMSQSTRLSANSATSSARATCCASRASRCASMACRCASAARSRFCSAAAARAWRRCRAAARCAKAAARCSRRRCRRNSSAWRSKGRPQGILGDGLMIWRFG